LVSTNSVGDHVWLVPFLAKPEIEELTLPWRCFNAQIWLRQAYFTDKW